MVVPINKGNYVTMEPSERIEEFERRRGLGWEERYRGYRKLWSELPQTQRVSEYPLQVDAELSNICNLKCPMCFRNKEDYLKRDNIGFMDFALFTSIIDEIAGHVPALRLSLRGESTLYPRFIDCVRYAKSKGIGEVSFLTNGSRLKPEFSEELIEAGVDWITISVDGLDETYESIRKPLKFSKTLENIMAIHELKRRKGALRPVVKVQSIWPAIRSEPERYYLTFKPYVDLVAFNPLIDYLGVDGKDEIRLIDDFCCPQIYQRLVIGADGIAIMCTNDEENTHYIGRAGENSIHEIWHGELLGEVRRLHQARRGVGEIPVCGRCFISRLTEVTEQATVEGRRVDIHNYVNRRQEIGQ